MPDGQQVAYVQGESSLEQTVNFPAAGNYAVKFYATQRAGYDPEQIRVLIDGDVVNTYQPSTSAPTFTLYKTDTFSVSAGNHTLKFQGYNPYGGDRSIILDMVSIPAIYSGGPDPTVQMPQITARPGETITAPITTTGAYGLKSFIININYDPNLLNISASDVKAGDLLKGWTVVPEVSSGVIHVSAYGTSGILHNEPGDLLEITYHIRPGASGKAALDIDEAHTVLFDVSDSYMLLDAHDGSIDIARRRAGPSRFDGRLANDIALMSMLADPLAKSSLKTIPWL